MLTFGILEARRAVRVARGAAKVIVFGSRARGDANDRSDFDFSWSSAMSLIARLRRRAWGESLGDY